MKSHFHCLIVGFGASFMLVAGLIGAEAKSDLNRPEARVPVVELAVRLSEPALPEPLPADLVHPFNPAAFGQPDPEELRALAAVQAAASAAAVQGKPSTDREFLQLIAARIVPSGTLMLGNDPLLIFGRKRLRVGDHLTVSYDGRDYELELTGIDRTNFTLRLNHDEITRPIKSAKSP